MVSGAGWGLAWGAVWKAVPASLSGATACAVTPGCRGVRSPSSGLNRVRVRDGHRVRVRAAASAGF